MKKLLLTFIIALMATSASALTLEEVIDSAKRNNPEIKSQEYSYKAAKSEKLKALGGFLPKASVSVNSGSRKTKIGRDSRQNSDIDSKTFNASQNLFDGFGSTFKLKEANNILSKERAIKDSKLQQISLGVIKAYLDSLRYKKLLELGEKNLKSQKNLFNYIGRRFRAKDATRAEISKAKADYIRAKNDNMVNKNNYDFARENLGRYAAIDTSELVEFEDVLIRGEGEDDQDRNIEGMTINAMQANPEVRIAKHGYWASRYKSKASKSALAPKVDLNFEVSEQEDSLFLNNRTQKDRSVYLNVTVPIFTSGLNYFDISSASNVRKSERYRYEAVKRQVRNSVIEYYGRQRNFEASYASAKELEKANKVYLYTLRKEERLGTKSIIELLEAKQDLYRSQIDVINMYYDRIYNKFELDALLGELI